MASTNTFNYKTEAHRYNYYYRRLKIFYQKPVTQVSTAVLFTLFTIIFFAAFAIRPTLVTIGELLRKIEEQEVVFQRAQNKTASLATAQQLYSQIVDDLHVIDAAIPPDYQIQQFLLSLEATAANLGIPIKNITIRKLTYPPARTTTTKIEEMGFSLSFDASYPDAKILISNLVMLPRLVTLDSISFAQSDAAMQGSPGTIDEITISLNCRTYYAPGAQQ